MNMLSENIIESYIASTKCVLNSYTVYEIIVVTNIAKMKNYQVVHKRYTDFRKLHKLVSKCIKELPVFPCKKLKKLDEDVIKERVLRFNFYLKYLCMLVSKNELDESIKNNILQFFTQ